VIAMNNPPVNGLGYELRSGIVAGLDQALADPAMQAVVLIGGTAILSGSFPLFLLGLALIGASRGSIDQTRYAAADAQLPTQRARANA
jgi:enoyl-CoA hydratase/carnithine racemase